jgi:hypothetical protein
MFYYHMLYLLTFVMAVFLIWEISTGYITQLRDTSQQLKDWCLFIDHSFTTAHHFSYLVLHQACH